MVLWFSQQRAQGIPVLGPICVAQAKYFFDELKLQSDFSASSDWLTRFQQRDGIRQITVQGEKLAAMNQWLTNLRMNSRYLFKMKVSCRKNFQR
jgi:hypothetical protein